MKLVDIVTHGIEKNALDFKTIKSAFTPSDNLRKAIGSAASSATEYIGNGIKNAPQTMAHYANSLGKLVYRGLNGLV